MVQIWFKLNKNNSIMNKNKGLYMIIISNAYEVDILGNNEPEDSADRERLINYGRNS